MNNYDYYISHVDVDGCVIDTINESKISRAIAGIRCFIGQLTDGECVRVECYELIDHLEWCLSSGYVIKYGEELPQEKIFRRLGLD